MSIGNQIGRSSSDFRSAFGGGGLGCPQCGVAFHSEATEGADECGEFDVLTCQCSSYPVVAGIPILKKESLGAAGQGAAEVVELIRQGRPQEALLALLMPATPAAAALAAPWMRHLPWPLRSSVIRHSTQRRQLPAWRAEARAFLQTPDCGMTACGFLDYYLRHLRPGAAGYHAACDYMTFRFSIPQHLVALSLAGLIGKPGAPILELGCGCGHMTRALLRRAEGQPVIGIDALFWPLFVAKIWIAPDANYLCCDADRSLPFRTGLFESVFSTDAFHYFPDKAACVREARRVLRPNGILILSSLNNAGFPDSGSIYRLHPAGYQSLVADMPHRLVADADLCARYLQKRGPDLSRSCAIEQLDRELRSCVVASERESLFRDHGVFPEWPHAYGKLALNPFYVQEGHDTHSLHLRRQFPSADFAAENAACSEYLPETVRITSAGVANLNAGRRTPEIESLISRFVVLGMPERYLSAPS